MSFPCAVSAKPVLKSLLCAAVLCLPVFLPFGPAHGQELKSSEKPPLHGSHWVAVTGKPLAASAGALIFARGGNAVDAAAAMLAATATMWDTLGWGGETQALIHDPRTGKVYGINALGAAPSGATVEYFRNELGMDMPPEYGPLAAVTPGTPGGLLVMLAEFGSLSLAEVLAPALDMAAAYPIEEVQVHTIESNKRLLRRWEHSRKVFLPNDDPANPTAHAAPHVGDLFSQPDLLATLNKLVDAEREALAAGKSREDAIMAAYERFYRGDIAAELVAATQEAGGLITMEDLDRWQVYVEEPVMTT
ncbi:MAG TPA: gamma-glutamyltransferase family protein, partial [Pseudomonadaceae bacterium]|nr:gamma-glutamyltransferase family protein [Pseudomonadaceae bacterium]